MNPREPLDLLEAVWREAAEFGTEACLELGEKGADAAKNLEMDSLGLEALQPLEIAQNRQSFLWKCLERNMRDLEKLGKKLGRRLDSAAFSLRRRGPAGLPRSRQPSTGLRSSD